MTRHLPGVCALASCTCWQDKSPHGDFVLPQYQEEIRKNLDPRYHEVIFRRIEQLDQEVKTKVYDELHNAKGINFIWEALDTQELEQRKFGIRTVLSTQLLQDYP